MSLKRKYDEATDSPGEDVPSKKARLVDSETSVGHDCVPSTFSFAPVHAPLSSRISLHRISIKKRLFMY